MRFVVPALGLSALALVGFLAASEPAIAAKSKMGCEVGKEVWDASAGRCVPGKGKARAKRSGKKKTAKAKAKKE